MERNLKIALIPKHQYIKMRDPALTSVDPMGFNPISKWTGHRFSRHSSSSHTPNLQIGKLKKAIFEIILRFPLNWHYEIIINDDEDFTNNVQWYW